MAHGGPVRIASGKQGGGREGGDEGGIVREMEGLTHATKKVWVKLLCTGGLPKKSMVE